MQKLLALSIVSLFLLTGAVAHAQTAPGSVAPGAACTADADCQDANGQSYGCFNGTICTVDGDAPADGTVAPGGACTNDNSCQDVGGQNYECANGICTLNAATAGTGSSAASTGATANGNFVPLTNLPVFQGIVGQPDLVAFFNALYKICIGIAATLAVIQIIIAGVMYMGGDSVTETKDARKKIGQAVLGLVLVLSPVLVFSIINPNILSLKINFTGINTGSAPAAPASTTGTGCAAGSLTNGQTLVGDQNLCCTSPQIGGTIVTVPGKLTCSIPVAPGANGCTTQFLPGTVKSIGGTDTATQQCCATQTGCSLSAMNTRTGQYTCTCQ